MIQGAVLTVSDRCSEGSRQDTSGPRASELLSQWGISAPVRVCPDGTQQVRDALHEILRGPARIILTTGGTGLTPTDRTPEATESLRRELDGREIPGLAEAIRRAGLPAAPAAVLSRALAVVVNNTSGKPVLIVNTAGSPGAVKDAVAVIGPLAAHIVEQLDGADHR